MATTKRIYGGDYNIVTETAQANINMYTDTVFISGNLVVPGSNTQVLYNYNGNAGASANLTFDYAANKLTLTGHQAFANVATPANVANAVVLYSNVTGSGGTGLGNLGSSATTASGKRLCCESSLARFRRTAVR